MSYMKTVVRDGSRYVLPAVGAMRTPVHDEIDDEMRTIRRRFGSDGVVVEGIALNTERTPLDESGHAYKDLDEVLSVAEDADLGGVVRRMYPVANLKGE